MDEALFMKPDLIKTAILPVAQQTGTALFALSTPQDYGHPTVQFFNTKNEHGKTIFRIVRIGKGCDSCQAKKIMCMHGDSVVSEGISSEKQNEFRHFYPEQVDLMLQEYGGVVSNSTLYCFSPDLLSSLVKKNHVPVVGPIDYILVTIDPAGGGRNEWGLCACYYDVHMNKQIILQSDGHCIRNPTPQAIGFWLCKSIEAVRARHSLLRAPPLIIACEHHPATVANTIAAYVQMLTNQGQIENVYMMNEHGPDGMPGVPKTQANTDAMVRYTNIMLNNEQVCFSEVFGSCFDDVGPHEAKMGLVTQLKNFKPHLVKITPEGERVYKIHGKGSGATNDDRAIAFIMQMIWHFQFMQSSNPNYEAIRDYSAAWRSGYVGMEMFGEAIPGKRLLRDSPSVYGGKRRPGSDRQERLRSKRQRGYDVGYQDLDSSSEEDGTELLSRAPVSAWCDSQ